MPITLVTGGGGFLGRAIVKRLLAQGRPVRVVGRSPQPDLEKLGVEFVRGDLSDPGVAAHAVTECDTVFHVAAKAGVWGSYQEFHDANVVATKNLLSAARAAGVKRFVHTSTPSVVFNGEPLSGADESLPYLNPAKCPAAYPVTKAEAERLVLAADADDFRTCAIRPHLIWGVGDNHLMPRVVAKARAGKLRIVGAGDNRVDLTHVDNAAHAHLLALDALDAGRARGKAYFLSDDAPVALWPWINELLARLDLPPVTRRVPVSVAYAAGAAAEFVWKVFNKSGEPPMTRFVAVELAKDHWFSVAAAKRDLGYAPVVDNEKALTELVAWLKTQAPHA
jgi:nucleoside-diphosphate-sugar epimerase